MWEVRNAYRILLIKPEWKITLGSVDGRIILKLILNKWYVTLWSGFISVRIGIGGKLL
jgi:hypothetical protein